MLISIIVPVYNSIQYLERCVTSIITQDYMDFQLVLVDDGSTDGSGDLCDRLSDLDKRIIVIHKKNGGVSSARNVGIEICKGDIIGFSDSDDFFEDGVLKQIESFFCERPSVDIVYAGFYNTSFEYGKYVKVLKHEKSGQCGTTEAIEQVLCNPNIMGSVWNKFYRRQAIGNVRFCESLTHCEDTAFNVEVLSRNRNNEVYITDVPIYNYYNNPNSVTTSYDRLFDENGVLKYNKSLHYIIDNCELKKLEVSFVNRAIFGLSIAYVYNGNIGKNNKNQLRNELKNTIKDYVFQTSDVKFDCYIKNIIKAILIILRIR